MEMYYMYTKHGENSVVAYKEEELYEFIRF